MGKRAREERRTIFLKARLRTDAGWSEVSIGIISSRGLMFRAQGADGRFQARHLMAPSGDDCFPPVPLAQF
jgi:hypothetical protein